MFLEKISHDIANALEWRFLIYQAKSISTLPGLTPDFTN
jgi:hypothetical protein